MNRPTGGTPAPPRAALVALPVGVVIVALGLWTFARGPEAPGVAGAARAAVDPALARIAVQGGDLPEGFRPCPFSGDIETHIERMEAAGPETHGQLVDVWGQLRAHGAVAAHASYWGDSERSCDGILDPELVGGGRAGGHVASAFSVVVRFRSDDAAAAAYGADLFGQSSLEGSPGSQVATGTATGLGPQAVVAVATGTPVPVHQAVWRHGSVHVLYGSENLPPRDLGAGRGGDRPPHRVSASSRS